MPATGGKLTFELNGAPCGSATVGAQPVRLIYRAPRSIAAVEIIAHNEDDAGVSRFSFTEGVHVLRLQVRARRTPVEAGPGQRGIARCPDGTIGRPCVDCVVKGIEIRICA